MLVDFQRRPAKRRRLDSLTPRAPEQDKSGKIVLEKFGNEIFKDLGPEEYLALSRVNREFRNLARQKLLLQPPSTTTFKTAGRHPGFELLFDSKLSRIWRAPQILAFNLEACLEKPEIRQLRDSLLDLKKRYGRNDQPYWTDSLKHLAPDQHVTPPYPQLGWIYRAGAPVITCYVALSFSLHLRYPGRPTQTQMLSKSLQEAHSIGDFFLKSFVRGDSNTKQLLLDMGGPDLENLIGRKLAKPAKGKGRLLSDPHGEFHRLKAQNADLTEGITVQLQQGKSLQEILNLLKVIKEFYLPLPELESKESDGIFESIVHVLKSQGPLRRADIEALLDYVMQDSTEATKIFKIVSVLSSNAVLTPKYQILLPFHSLLKSKFIDFALKL